MLQKRLIYTVFILGLFYTLTFSQTGSVTFHFQNKTLREALREISEKTGVRFIYNDALVEGKTINGTLSGDNVDKVLYDILPESDIAFKKIVSGKIVLYAAEKQYIKGYVYDGENGEALPYANILLEGTRTGTASNESGFFALANPGAAPCTLSVSYIGYTPKKIADVSGGPDNVKVGLKKAPLETGEISVSADREPPFVQANQPGLMHMVPERMKNLPTTGAKEIHRSMQMMPGVSGVHEKPEGLYVLGGTPDQNLVLLDGIPVYKSTHFFGLVSAFHPDAIDSVNIYLGGYPARYAGHLSGVIDYKVQSGLGRPLSFGASVDFLEANGYIRTPITSKAGLFLSVRSTYLDLTKGIGYNDLYGFLVQGDNYLNNPNYHYKDFTVKTDIRINPRESLSVTGYYGRDYVDRRNTEGSYYSLVDKNRWRNNGAAVNWKKEWAPELFSSLSFIWSNFFAGYEKIDPQPFGFTVDLEGLHYRDENTFTNQTGKIDNFWRPLRAHTIYFGGSLHSYKLETVHSKQYGIDPAEIVPELWAGCNRKEMNRVEYSGYIQDEWKVLSSMGLNWGVHFSKVREQGKNYTEPRISMFYNYKGIKVSAAWGRYHQFVNQYYGDEYYQDFTPYWNYRINPSSAQHKLLNIGFHWGPVDMTATGYLKDYTDLGIPVGVGGEFRNGTGSAKGFVLTLKKMSGAVTGWMSYHRSLMEYIIPGFNESEPFPPPYNREHEFKMTLQKNSGEWRFALTGVYATGRHYTPLVTQYSIETLYLGDYKVFQSGKYNSATVPDYKRIDVRVSRHLENKWFLDWDFGIAWLNVYEEKNIWDKGKTELIYYPYAAPKTMMTFMPMAFIRVEH
ncbi:carboxypeptidase-like regulatory domain-containing protein [candidate division KSB1 bacterium]|nr:carboxypeptidase-like regulatory domain-containing protein [candidate division KSB1 bacterium]